MKTFEVFQSMPVGIRIVLPAVFLVVLAACLYGKNKVWSELKRWFIITLEQLRSNTRKVFGHFCVIAVGGLIAFFLSYYLVSNEKILSTSYKALEYQDKIQLTSTTLYMTFVTVILALMALAVTTYIFLNDSLTNREFYEQECIKTLKGRERRKLFENCVLSGACLALCLVIDNINLSNDKMIKYLRFGVVLATSFDIFKLGLFINSIVNHEKHLIELARSYISFNQRDLILNHTQYTCESKMIICGSLTAMFSCREDGNDLSDANKSNYIKHIGDLETLVNNIILNHESDYHFQHGITRTGMLKAILEKKGTFAKQSDISYESISDTIKRLIEIRNCLWILDNAGESIHIQKELECDVVLGILEQLKPFAFQNEQFIDLVFSDVDFSEAVFTYSNLRKSALTHITFFGANLKNADFSNGLLQDLNLRNAICQGGVFSGARIIEPGINRKTVFNEAVLNDCELTNCCIGSLPEDGNKEDPSEYQFRKVLCKHANLVNAVLTNIDFSNAVFTQSTFSGATLKKCKLEWVNLSKVVMDHATIEEDCVFEFADCSDLVAVESKWGKRNPKKMNLQGARFVGANFKRATLESCGFQGTYTNDASFSEATIKGCDFSRAILTHVDFSGARISSCIFIDSLLRDTLFRGNPNQSSEPDNPAKPGQNEIHNSDFSNADMTNCNIRNVVFVNCRFDRTIMDDSVVRNTQFIGCSFEDTRWNNILLFSVEWEKCHGTFFQDAVSQISFGTEQDKVRWEFFRNCARKEST